MKIVYQDKEIHIEPKKAKTTVREFLNYLKPKINSSDEEELVLLEKRSDVMDKHICLDEYSELDLENIENNKEFILINQINNTNSDLKSAKEANSIEKLVMLVTNAKEQIQPPSKAPKKRQVYNEENMEYLEQILSGGNFPLNNVRFRSEIVNLLNNPFVSDSNASNVFFPGFSSSSAYANNSAGSSQQSNSNANQSQTASVSNTVLLPNNPLPVRQRPALLEPNASHVTALMEMGFPEDRSKRALIASKNNLNHAMEMILNGYDLDMPDSALYSGKSFCNF